MERVPPFGNKFRFSQYGGVTVLHEEKKPLQPDDLNAVQRPAVQGSIIAYFRLAEYLCKVYCLFGVLLYCCRVFPADAFE